MGEAGDPHQLPSGKRWRYHPRSHSTPWAVPISHSDARVAYYALLRRLVRLFALTQSGTALLSYVEQLPPLHIHLRQWVTSAEKITILTSAIRKLSSDCDSAKLCVPAPDVPSTSANSDTARSTDLRATYVDTTPKEISRRRAANLHTSCTTSRRILVQPA